MRSFKFVVEYDGTDFCGWQRQGQGERTVQGELEAVCLEIFKQPVLLIASGRTDSGVHAQAQVVSFKAATRMSCGALVRAFNSLLPPDIAVLRVKEVDGDFHAQYSVKEKTYRYTILNAQQRSVFLKNHVYWYAHLLDITAMRRASRHLIGCHDFKSFQAKDALREGRSTVRTITRLRIVKEKNLIRIDISADGFLYKMVRNIVGTLLAVGSGRCLVADMLKILKARDRATAKNTAPAQGLCLLRVKY